jgi:hypothetical protein
MGNFTERFIKQPPVLFPLAALFHVAMLVFSIYNASTEPLSSLIWLQPLWMLGYTVAWLFVCGMKRWAAYAYIAVATLSLGVHFFAKNELYHSSFFLLDVILAMMVMAYIKRFS